ncbi:MAG: YoaK family protein [Acetobacteraceae bacterium]
MRRDGAIWLLSITAGGIDALSFVALGAFTSAMSGNAILLGIALSQNHLSDASRALLAFAGFIIGVGIASSAGALTPRRVLLIEAVLLGVFAVLWPARVGVLHPPLALSHNFLPWMTLLAGAAMGIQSVAARRLGVPGINTVVFTTTVAEIIGALTAAALGRTPRRIEAKTWCQIGAFLLYVTGAAVLGALAMHDHLLAAVPAFVCVVMAAILA